MLPKGDKPENPLFTNGANFDTNACVGTNGGPYDNFDYGKGFFEGGHAIVQAAVERKAPVDILIYPAAFSYRHGIELLLKQLVVTFTQVLRTRDNFAMTHGLRPLWDKVIGLNRAIETPLIEPQDIARAAEIIGHFDAFDQKGQVFRYPQDNRGNQHLVDHKIINVEVLRDVMRELQAIMEHWYFQAEERLDYQRRNEYQR